MGRWQGVSLCLVVLAATLWLGATGQLALYIHPRYVTFTLVMAVLAAVLCIGAFVLRHGQEHDEGDEPPHSHEPDGSSSIRAGRPARWRNTTAVVLAAATAVIAGTLLLVVPPATLTSATASQRDMNAATAQGTADFVTIGADFTEFSVKEWSALLGQASSPAFYEGKTADVVGFVTADATDPQNIYFVSRFIVTCCAVDAQPVGVPVFAPGWADSLQEDQWVRVQGAFSANPAGAAQPAVVLMPAKVDIVDQPADPYEH